MFIIVKQCCTCSLDPMKYFIATCDVKFKKSEMLRDLRPLLKTQANVT